MAITVSGYASGGKLSVEVQVDVDAHVAKAIEWIEDDSDLDDYMQENIFPYFGAIFKSNTMGVRLVDSDIYIEWESSAVEKALREKVLAARPDLAARV